MFRRLVPLWVIVSTIMAGGSAQAQMPFPVDLVPTRTALERLGLERQWFGVIPLVETERLMKITLAGGSAVCPDRLCHASTRSTPSRAGCSGRLNSGNERASPAGSRPTRSRSIVTNANIFHALDKKTGRPIWQHNLGTIPTSTPACDEDLVMVGLTSGKICWLSTSSKSTRQGNESILTDADPRPGAGTRAARFSPGRCRPASSRLRFDGRKDLRGRGRRR